MNLTDFVQKIVTRFPPDLRNGDTLENCIDDYVSALSTGGVYDFEKAFVELMRCYTFKTIPTPKIILEVLKKYETKPKTTTNPAETEILIVEKNGLPYEYGVQIADYIKDIEWFDREGFSIIKFKNCDENCQRCNYNHVCETAKLKRDRKAV